MPSRDREVNRFIRQYHEKKQAKTRRRTVMRPFKLVFGIIFVLVIAYFAVQIFLAFNSPMTTTTALMTTVNDEFSVVGYLAREETVLTAEYSGILLYTSKEGQKVARGYPYAATYSSETAASLKRTISKLDERIGVLEAAFSANTDTTSIKSLAENIYNDMYYCAEFADTESFSQLGKHTEELKKHIVTRDLANTSPQEIETLLNALRLQRGTLQERMGVSETALYTPVAGFFSSHTDGYEDKIDVKRLNSMTAEDIDALDRINPKVDSRAVGKMVTGYRWFFITNLRQEEAALLRQGTYINLSFDAMGDRTVRVYIQSMGKREPGEPGDIPVIFRSDEYAQEMVALRKQSASIILKSYTGLKVPKDAIRVDSEGRLGVYVITGMYAEFKKISVLYETRDYFIVATDPTTTRSLLVYDLVIVNGKGLAHKKVIK